MRIISWGNAPRALGPALHLYLQSRLGLYDAYIRTGVRKVRLVLRRRPLAILLLSMMALAWLAVPQAPPGRAATSSVPAALSVEAVPSVLPADGGTYPAIYVSLVDSSGTPTLAVSNVTVFLTSSTLAVGVVLNSSIVIPAGKGYAMADFRSTPTAGTSVITASASGLGSVTAAVSTAVLTGYPTSISLTAVPSEVNSTSTSSRSGTLIVEFQDQVGQPAKAAVDTQVTVYSSSTKILSLNMTSFTMKAGQLLKVLSFSTGFVPGYAVVSASASELGSGTVQVAVLGRPPLALELFAQPDHMVTPGSGRVVVELTDLNGNPARAPVATVVQLRSTNASAVSVPLTVTIPAGAIYKWAPMTSLGTTPANATITASSSGLKSAFAAVTTYPSKGVPWALELFVGPAPVLADNGSYSAVVVSLVNKTGFPTSTSSPISVTLTSSQNSSVGAFGIRELSDAPETLQPGNNFAWPVNFTSTFVPGTTALTVSAQNLLTGTGTLSTFGATPSRIAVSSLFTAVPADGGSHPALEVSLEDSSGAPAVAASPVTVRLSSSQSGIAQVSSPIVINPGKSAVIADVTTTSVSGTANVTAYSDSLSSGYSSAFALIQTATPSPSAVGAYLGPGTVTLSPSGQGAMLLLQLQNSAGNPSKARQDVTLTITSSDTAVFNRTLQVQISQGASFVRVPVVPLGSGSTTFTVTSPGLATATVKLQVLPSPFVESLAASSSSVFANQTATVTLSMSMDGQGVAGANVTWSATGGTVTPATSATDGQGQASTTLKPLAVGVANVTAVVSSAYAQSQNFTTRIIVVPTPRPAQSNGNNGFLGTLLSFPYVLVLVGVAAAAGVAVLLFLRRRRRPAEEEGEVGEDEEQGFSFYRVGPVLGGRPG